MLPPVLIELIWAHAHERNSIPGTVITELPYKTEVRYKNKRHYKKLDRKKLHKSM